MIKKLSAPFEALGTWFKTKTRTDPFFVARIKIIASYFCIVAVLFVGNGVITDYLLRGSLLSVAVSSKGQPVRDAFDVAVFHLWVDRTAAILLFAIAIYLITELVLRPIKKSAELQKRFVTTVSHELRTPLTVMRNGIEVALRKHEVLSRERAIELLSENLEEIEYMTDTIRFLLEYAVRSEQKQIQVSQRISLASLLAETVQLLGKRYTFGERSISIIQSEEAYIEGDRAALRSLFFNLLENSLMHTPSLGRVTIFVHKEKQSVRVSVSDSGSGIDPQDLPYIFEPFYRGIHETASGDTANHMGLGLSLVREVVRLHHASIRVDSVLQKGTTISILFPRA